MSLKIDVPNINYTAGSPVNGTVTLVGDSPVDIQTIAIRFIGRSNIFVRFCPELADGSPLSAPDPYSDETRFFAYESIIIGVQLSARSRVGPLTLPSSFADQGLSGLTESTCSITYTLEAHLSIPPDGKHHLLHSDSGFTKVTTKELSYSAAGFAQSSDPGKSVLSKELTVQSLHLLPGNENRHLTLKQHFQSTFHHGDLPKEAFKLGVSIPHVAVIGKVLPIVLSLQHDMQVERASGLEKPPKILLQHIEVVIQVNTDVASPAAMRGGWVEGVVLASSDYPKSPDDAQGMADSLDIGEMLKPIIPRDFYPTFETEKITRDYSLDVLVAVECAGKTFKEAFRAQKLLLLRELSAAGS